MSTFGTLNTAITGLMAAQRAMDATGQNVVNANTPGYSRQRVEVSSQGAVVTSTFHTGANSRGGTAIGGVRVDGVSRIHDAFLEGNRAAAGGRQQALQAQESMLDAAQLAFAEPGRTGLQASLDSFYASWHELSLNPSDGAAGSVVIQKGLAVTDQLHNVSAGLSRQWSNSRAGLLDAVAQTNQAAADLGVVNGKIAQGRASGQPVNELLDQRDTLVRKLADLVGAYAVQREDGGVSVAVNGITIVSGTVAEKLEVSGGTDITQGASDPPTIRWKGTAVPVESGRAAGLLAGLRTDLPGLLTQLDGVAVALRDAVNTVHQSGFTLAGAAGGDFFSGSGAQTLEVVPTDPAQLAMASAVGVMDGTNALKLGDLADDVVSAATLGGTAGASARWRSLTTELGVQLQSLANASSVQDAVVQAADDAVHADSGVNLDEEMTSMLLFQRSYQASARVISTVDEMLDTLVNRTGVVGR